MDVRTVRALSMLAALLALSACAPSFSLLGAHVPKPPPAAAPPGAPTCPGALSADLPPQPVRDPKAGVAEPQTDAQKAAFALYLDWLARIGAWSRAGWARAAEAKAWCSGR
jgi:hypothetical protein